MDQNEDDDLMRRYLFLEKKVVELMKEMAELKKALRGRQATARNRHLNNKIVVVSDEEDGETKSLDVIGMVERGFGVKLEKGESSSDVDSQTEFRCPQPECVCLFKYPSDLVEYQANVHPAADCQFEVSSQNGASSSQLQDDLRITDTDSNRQSVKEEVFKMVVRSGVEENDAQSCDVDAGDVQLDQEINESNQKSKTVIKIEEAEEIDRVDGEAKDADEADGYDVDESDGRDSIGKSSSGDGDFWTMLEDDGDETDSDDSATELDDNEFDPVASRSPTNRRFHCPHPGCARSFKRKNDLTKHRNIHTTRFQCQVCQTCFPSTYKLKHHLAVHSDDRPFACDWAGCGVTFKWKKQLKQHRVVHSNERPYQCDKKGCGWSFKSKHILNQHLKYTHSSLRRFKCQMQECDKRFKTKTDLKGHMNCVHSDVRNFRCHFKDCGKTFKARRNLVEHGTVHSDERPFQCQVKGCGKRYKMKNCLTEHVKSVHL